MINANIDGDAISIVPTRIIDTVADASVGDEDFEDSEGKTLNCYILAKTSGTLVVKDLVGNIDTITVTAGDFFEAMMAGTIASGSDAIEYTIYR